MTYKIVRLFQKSDVRDVIKRGLTLEAAQAWCKDPETSSTTCKSASRKARTVKHGPWFDGYEEEGNLNDSAYGKLVSSLEGSLR